MRLKFNRTNIKKLEPRATRYEVTDTETTALRLRITPSGIKTFVLVYRNAEHQQKRFTIGKYGDLTPEQAREIAVKKLAEVKLGKDPASKRSKKYSCTSGWISYPSGKPTVRDEWGACGNVGYAKG